MKVLELTLPTPGENLACDEALLEECEESRGEEILRFWEPREHFVVLGYGNRIESEVNMIFSRRESVPILRRCSGGGTVVQGPGCLNYALVLRIQPELQSISQSNSFILSLHRQALQPLIREAIEIQGFSDLAIDGAKFSGNAQKRKRQFMLFHGTFLLALDIEFIERTLPIPSKQPEYRRNRSHRDFLTHIAVEAAAIKEALKRAWGAAEVLREVPRQRIDSLIRNKYATDEWRFKF
ncbi:MAG: lipoate--protein ligase family protein [Candidatus Binatia bacterium]